jgi:hypothetical protein
MEAYNPGSDPAVDALRAQGVKHHSETVILGRACICPHAVKGNTFDLRPQPMLHMLGMLVS